MVEVVVDKASNTPAIMMVVIPKVGDKRFARKEPKNATIPKMNTIGLSLIGREYILIETVHHSDRAESRRRVSVYDLPPSGICVLAWLEISNSLFKYFVRPDSVWPTDLRQLACAQAG